MSNSALIIVDMLNDFTDPQGLVYYPQNRQILPGIQRVLEECRKRGMLIVFLRHCYRRHKYDKNLCNMRPNCIEGTVGSEIDPMLKVDPIRDYIVNKRRYSGFVGTDLDLILREHRVENVIIVGTKTNCCIRATVTDAYNLDYQPIVISDCVTTNDETVNLVHLTDIKKYLGRVMTSEELFDLLNKGEIS